MIHDSPFGLSRPPESARSTVSSIGIRRIAYWPLRKVATHRPTGIAPVPSVGAVGSPSAAGAEVTTGRQMRHSTASAAIGRPHRQRR